MSGSVVSAGIIAGMVGITASILGVGAGVVHREALHSAADLAALGAADALFGFSSDDPCLVAQRIARANDATLGECEVHATSVSVSVQRSILGATTIASARAGLETG